MTEWVEAGLTFLAVLKVEALASECTAHLDALSPSHATCPSDQTTHTATASICPKEKSLFLSRALDYQDAIGRALGWFYCLFLALS
jgi:hypothetical protein